MSQVKLTIPDEICEKLKVMAKEEDRSLNNYIHRVLKMHVQDATNANANTNTLEEDTPTSTNKPVRRKSIIGNDSETKNIWEGEDPRWYQ